MPTRREAFAAAAALAVAPLAAASGSPDSEPTPEAPEPTFSPKEWKEQFLQEEWRERCRLDLEAILRRNEVIYKAHDVLMRFGFDIKEVEKVRKDISKHMNCEEHYSRFTDAFFDKWYRNDRMEAENRPNWNLVSAWDAILVTFRANCDGFKMLDVDMWWEEDV